MDEGVGHHDEPELTLGALAVVGGLLLGGAVGYVLTPTEWVDVNGPLHVGATPRGGLRVSVSLAFR